MPIRRRAGSRRSEAPALATLSRQTNSFSTLLGELEKGVQDADLPRRGCNFAAGQLEGLTNVLIDMVDKGRFDADTVSSAWMSPGGRSALLQLYSVLLRAPLQRPPSQPNSFSHSYPLHLITRMLLRAFSQPYMQDREAFLAHVLAPALAAQVLPAASAFVAHCTRGAAAEPPGPQSYSRRDIEAIGLPCVNSMVVLASLEPCLQLPCKLGMAGPAVVSVLATSYTLEHAAKAACRVPTPCTVLNMGNTLQHFTMILEELKLLGRGPYTCTAAAVLNSGALHRIGSGPCLQYYLALFTLSQLRVGPRAGGPLYGLQADALLPVCGGKRAGEVDGDEAEADDTWLRDTLSLWTFFHSRLGVLKDGVVSLEGLFRLCLEVAEAGVEGLRNDVGDGASGAGDRVGGQGGGGGGGASGGSGAGAAAGWWPSPVAAIQAVMFTGLLLDPAPYATVNSMQQQQQEAEACEGSVTAASGGQGGSADPETVDRMLFGNSSSQNTSSSSNSSSTAAAGTPASCDGGDGGQAGGRAPGVRASAGRLRAWWRTTVGVVQACLDSEGLAPHAMADLLCLQLHGELTDPAPPPAPPRNLAAALSAGYVPCLERFLRQAQRASDTPQRAGLLLELVSKGVHLPYLISYGDVRQVAALVVTVGKLLARPTVASSSEGLGGEVPQTGTGLLCADWIRVFPSLSEMTSAALQGVGDRSAASGSGGASGACSGSRRSSSNSNSGSGSAGSMALTAGEATGADASAPARDGDGAARVRALASLALARWLPVLARVGATPSPPEPPTSTTSQATTLYLLLRTARLTAILVVLNHLPTLVSEYQCSVARGDAAAAASWRGLLLHDINLPRRLGPLLRQLEAAHADGMPVKASYLPQAPIALESLLSAFPEVLHGALAADAQLIGSLRKLFGPFGLRPSTPLLLGLEELAVAGTPVGALGAGQLDAGLARAGAAASEEQAGGGSSYEPRAAALVPPCRLVEALALPLCSNPLCRSLEGPSEAGLKLSRCSRCGEAWYCCRECQAEHWRAGHKEACKGAGAAPA